MTERFIIADVLEGLAQLADESVQCVVTSPPYWGLRDYGTDGQLGLEPTPEEYVANMVAVFGEVRRVLRGDGTLWLNLGDSYTTGGRGGGMEGPDGEKQRSNVGALLGPKNKPPEGLKPKDLVGIPWRVAFALQADGWYLRSDIIWSKPNPMPESVTDRPTKAHEYLFLMSKNQRYFYDAEAIKEPSINAGKIVSLGAKSLSRGQATGAGIAGSGNAFVDSVIVTDNRNRRSVWEIATQPYSGAHFATFPENLAKPCVMAGSATRDTVLDPFFGSGTVAVVCRTLNRDFIGIDLDPRCEKLAQERLGAVSLPIPFGQKEPGALA